MGLGNFLKNLFGLSNQNVDQMANKASVLGDEAFEKIKEAASTITTKVPELYVKHHKTERGQWFE